MGMWRSLHPFNSADTSAESGRRRSGSRRPKARPSAEARKALNRRALIERFEERAMLSGAPALISILANSGDVVYSPNTAGQMPVLHTSPRELDLLFNQGTVIDPTTLGGIQVVGAGVDGQLNTSDDAAIQPGFVGMGSTPNEVVMRFAQTLADGQYEITLLGSGPMALADSNSPPDLFNSGNSAQPNLQVKFAVDAGPHVVSVVPQPVALNANTGALQQNTNEIDVYFDKAIKPQSSNQLDKGLFQLIVTNNTASTTDDGTFTPSSVSFDPATNKATLLFPFSLDTVGGGAFRLRIGNDSPIVTTAPLTTTVPEPGSTFGDSSQPSLLPLTVDLESTAAHQHQILQTTLGASPVNADVGMPGGNTGLGVRSVPVQQHIDYSASPLGQAAFTAKPVPGTIPTYTYNFPDVYGGPAVAPLHNVITGDQEALARQIFQLWSTYLGVQFKEVSSETLGAADFGIVTGVVQAVDASASSSLQAIAGPALTSPITANGVPEYLAVMNAQVYSTESLYGGPWFTAAMQQIGRLLGLGYDGEGPPGTIMGLGGVDPATGAAAEPVFPGNADILHGQYIYRTQSDNVDMYTFTLHSSGQFSAETIAQRLTDAAGNPTPSQLNSVLTLYSQTNVIQVPDPSPNSPVGANVFDGGTFSISDGTHPQVTFEFAANGRRLTDGNTPIAYSSSTDTAHNVAVAIAAAVNAKAKATGLNVTANVQFDQVVLSGPVTVTHDANQAGVTYTLSRQIISRNDDYFGNDSLVRMDLPPGIYYVAVTSAGNTQFDPNVAGSGAGGTTQGPYDLKLDFTPDPTRTLTDLDGNPLAGNSNGTTGGAYDFWFNVGNTIFVDKAPPSGVTSVAQVDGGGNVIASAPLFTNIDQATQLAATRMIAPAGNWTAPAGSTTGPTGLDRQTFVVNDGVNPPVTFEFAADGRQVTDGNAPVNFNSGNAVGVQADSPQQVAQQIANAINAEIALGLLSLPPVASPSGNIVDVSGASSIDAQGSAALLAAPRIVRILGTAGADNSIGVPLSATVAATPPPGATTPGNINPGQTFQIASGSVTATFEFAASAAQVSGGKLPDGNYAVVVPIGSSGQAIATAMAVAINASSLASASGGTVVASVPTNATASTGGVAWWISLSSAGALTINAQGVPALSAVSNAQPYEIGHSQFGGGPLADGANLTVPQGVTVMIDAGAVIKLEGANISVGVNSPNVDRRDAALQVLGTPTSSVFFTSFHDNTIGTLTDSVTAAAPGDWGGIVFGSAADLEDQGVFLDTVNHARLTYGGGAVSIDGLQSSYTPIHLAGSRPTITNNTILLSHDAAISADPDSFRETIFGSPAYDPTTGQGLPVAQAFTTDYERAGPDISGNTLAITQPGSLGLTAPAGNQIVAGETFVVVNPNTGVSSVFEFVNDLASPTTVAGQLLTDGHYAVLFNPGKPAAQNIPAVPPDTAAQMAVNIVSALSAAPIGVTASSAANSAQVTLHGASAVSPSNPSSFTAPSGAMLADGETFVVVNLTTGARAIFEFDSNGQVAAGDIAVAFTFRDSATTVATAMTAAINGSNLGVSAVTAGGLVLLSGATDFRFGQSGIGGGGNITLTAVAGNALTDGTTFQVANLKTGSVTTFQYQLNTPNAVPLVAGNIAIVYAKTDTNAAIAAKTAAAINAADLGVSAVVSTNLVSLIEAPTGKFASPLGVSSSVVANTINGLFVRTQDSITQTPQTLTVAARWTATDIPYVLSDNLVLQGNPGGPLDNTPRISGRLEIDPGATIKLGAARIETQIGANLIAEGTASLPIVLTSLHDDTYGGGGTFATDGVSPSSLSPANLPAPGDWSGLYFAPASRGSLDHALVSYGGGNSTLQGNADAFDAIEIHQADVRIANSTISNNAKGQATTNRTNLGGNDAATIYVLGAQPVLVNNTFENNQGAAISINANSLTSAIVPDPGRSTGAIERFTQFDNNRGPLVRLNSIGNVTTNIGAINGMFVRGGTLDTASVWDDTDIVHVVEGQIQVPNVDSMGGLTLESSPSASLVVKFKGAKAGLTATGTPLDITNRIGGSVQVIGTPNHNVVLTALSDETVGAGLTPDGRPNLFTDNAQAAIQSGQALLPTVPYVPQGTLISNDVATNVVGHFEVQPGPGGDLPPARVTAQGLSQLLLNQNFLFDYGNYVDVGSDGNALRLSGTTITQQPTLVSQDTVVSGGTFAGANGTVAWTVTTSFKPGSTQMVNQVSLSSSQALGNIRFINYLDEDVPPSFSDDLLFVQGTPGQPGFQVFTIDGPQRVGLSQSGVYLPGPQLVNATYTGWAADSFDNLQTAITGPGTTYTVAGNINTTNLPPMTDPQLGQVYGEADQTTAFAWDVDPTSTSSLITTFLSEVATPAAQGGQWKGVTLDQYSNDTNVATVNETEPAYTGGVGTNDTPATAQPLGQLATSLKSGDDTQRLGFAVNGTISPNHPSDVDVYSFQAQPGTQVWLDLGQTSPGLDSVLELVDRNGTVLARSDNSADEALNPGLLTLAPPSGIGFAGNLARPLAGNTTLVGNYDASDSDLSNTLYDPASLSLPGLRDLNSTNALDAGFRVVLPVPTGGNSNAPAQYFVRVRSRGADINNLLGGLSSGSYQLQVRLQEAAQIPGSTVQYADIRFATTGVTVQGLPAHSPLVADAGETTDPTHSTDASAANQPSPLPTAQDLGNLLTTDRNTISLSGSLDASAANSSLSTQVDWYKFTLNYNLVQVLQGGGAADKTFSTIFDVDYANGLARPNTTISVFDAAGNLIYVGRDSNVADDQPTPQSSNGLSDLTHGSSGPLDPYIGSVQLPAGETGGTSNTYYVAISSDATLPQALDGTFTAGSANALVRLEPIDSIDRVAEDHIGSQGGETAQPTSSLTALFNGTIDTTSPTSSFSPTNPTFDPTKPVLANAQQTQQIASLNTSAVQYTLGDVQLFVNQQPPGDTLLPPQRPAAGELFSINLPNTSTASALTTDIGPLPGINNLGYSAMAMRNDGQLYGLTFGRTDANAGSYNLIDTGTAQATAVGNDNILTGQMTGQGGTTFTAQNVGVQIRAMAYLQNGVNRELFVIGNYVGGAGGGAPFQNGLFQLDPNTGAVIGPGPRNTTAGAFPFSPVLLTPGGVSLTEQITGMAVIGNALYAVTDQGGLYLVNDPGTAGASLQFITQVKDASGKAVLFSGVTNGPPDVNSGAYAGDLFGVDAKGNLYAFNTSGALQNIFNGGTASSVALGVTNITSLAFSTLDYNLWHVTDHRAADAGHGVNSAPDNSRDPQSAAANQPQDGNLSYYFGLEDPNGAGVITTASTANPAAPPATLQPGAANYATNPGVYGTYNLPGGALGSLKTNSFSLANYSAGDKPTLYFDYFLDTGMTAGSTAGFKSSARVMISTDNGATWEEVATNDPTRTAYNLAADPLSGSLAARQNSQTSELPGFASASSNMPATTLNAKAMVDPRQQVQQLFDATGSWRQARIDLGNYAGQSNLMLRFDFSTAGSMNDTSLPSGLPGDQFGVINNPATRNQRGQNNAHEGFYVDDVVVGLAERGEMVTDNSVPGAPGNTQFFTTPQSPNPNAPTQNFGGAGPYQLDIRHGTEYGVTVTPTTPDISLIHSYDANDRLTDGFTIVAPSGSSLVDAATFQISDSSQHTVTFEFNDTTGAQPTVSPGNIAINFQPTSTAAQVAAAIAAAINANATLVGVRAGTVQNTINGMTSVTGSQVNLFGATNLTSAQALVGTITVSLADHTLQEGSSSTTTVTVSRPTGSAANPVFVTVSATDVAGGPSQNVRFLDANNNPLGATATVLIPAGQTSATVTLQEIDQLSGGNAPLADGPQKVQISASAQNYGSIADTLDVVDAPNVVPTLTLSLADPLSGTIVENAGPGAAHATVTRNTPTNVALTVTLTSLDPSSAAVPATVTIPIGATSATFAIDAIDDNVLRAQPINVTIVAAAINFLSGTTALAVQDDGDTNQVPLTTPVWQAQGPAPITGGQTTNTTSGPYNDPVAGAIETVLTVPNNPNVLYVGTVNGGIWRTTDALDPAPTWTPLTDNMPSLSIGAMQFDTTDPTFKTIIAGNGDFSSFANAGGSLSGLMRTTDGGQTWTSITPAASSLATPVGMNISGVAERGNIIMAAGNSFFGLPGGLERSTDGGQTFTTLSGVLTSGLPAGPVTDLVGDPIDSNRFYVAVLGANGGIFTSGDAGATWSDVTPANLRSIINTNPQGDNIRIADDGQAVYFGYEQFNAGTGQTDLAVLDRSPAVGLSSVTWAAMDLPYTVENGNVIGLNPGGQGDINFSIVADPTNPNLVYVGGDRQPGLVDGVNFPNSIGASDYTGRLFRGDASRPAGSQWTPITDKFTANGSAPHADSRHLAIDSQGRLIEADNGGIYTLSSPTASVGAWTSLIGNNLQITEIHSVAYDTLTHTILSGNQDNGVSEQAAANNDLWTAVPIPSSSLGNGGDVAIDNDNSGLTNQSIRYTSGANLGGFLASTYDANNKLVSTTTPALVVAGGQSIYQFDAGLPLVTTIKLDAVPPAANSTEKRMVIGGGSAVYESFDGGQTLTPLRDAAGNLVGGSSGLFGASMAYGGYVGGVANPDVLWVGVGSSVYLRRVAGAPLALTNYAGGPVESLSINSSNWLNAFIVDGNGHVWTTADGGRTFADITGNLTQGASPLTGDLHSIVFVPGASTNLLYVGARDGVYQMQTQSPGVWSRYGALMPDVPVFSLQYVPGQQLLVAGTLGRGAFTASAIGVAGDLTITLDQQTVSDDPDTGGMVTGTVTRSGTFGDLPVTLESSDPLLLPSSTVTIPDGQSSATFSMPVVDLTDALGNEVAIPRETVIITPQAAGLNSIGGFVNISEDNLPATDDAPQLTVSLSSKVIDPNQGVTAITGTVSRNMPTDQPLTVTLVSSDPLRASVPTTVTIPIGALSAAFNVTAVDQFVSDRQAEWVTITASAVTYQGISVTSDNGDGNDNEDADGAPDGDEGFTVKVEARQHLVAYNRQGDANLLRQQGQIVIQDNRISNSLDFGITVSAAPRDAGGSIPYPGVPMNLQPLNTDGVVPGAAITSNLLVGNAQGGIQLVGDSDAGNVAKAVIPIARVLNNTIYGGVAQSGVGVQVGPNVSPTVLNNVFANLATGVSVDPTSSSTVLEGSVYQNNGVNLSGSVANGGDLLSYSLSPTDPLFADAAGGDFYLAAGSKAIDSAINQLSERNDLSTAKSLTGIAPSPTNAPSYDLFGQLRTGDRQTTPNGVGSTLFKDRGAIERVDYTGPTSTLVSPVDNSSADQDPTLTVVHQVGGPLATFAVQLQDANGAGIDDGTVTSSKFDLYRNGTRLTAGSDYFFQYDTNTKTVYFVPATGVWTTGNQYTIFIDNGTQFDAFGVATQGGIKDLAGNALQPNRGTGSTNAGYTEYDILLQSASGDAPSVGVPPLQSTLENAPITFSSMSAVPNPITIFDISAPGDTVTVTLQTMQGTLTISNQAGLTNIMGNGTGNLQFTGTVSAANAALDGLAAAGGQSAVPGLTFTPSLNFRSPPTVGIQVTVFDPALGTAGLQGTNVAAVNVIPVNQKPVVNVPLPLNTTENPINPLVVNGVSVSDPDAAQTDSEQVTITAPQGTVILSRTTGLSFSQGSGNGSSMTFTGALSDINAALSGMQFLPANNFAGQTTINLSVNDLGNSGNAPDGSPGPSPQTGTGTVIINVAAVNQPPFANQIPTVTVNETSQSGVTTTIDLRQYIGDPDENNVPPEAPPTLSLANNNTAIVSATLNGYLLTLTYVPYQRGTAQIAITATDNNSGPTHPTAQTTLTVVVNPISFPPVAANDTYTYTPGFPLTVDAKSGVLANDVDHDNTALQAHLTQVPLHGRLQLDLSGAFIYTPDPGFSGPDSFTYRADEGPGTVSANATVFLNSSTGISSNPQKNELYVTAVYEDVLARAPDAGGLAYWTNLINQGAAISSVAEAIAHSAEYYANFVIKPDYLKLLGRPADAAGVQYWTSQMQAGVTDQQLEAQLAASDEFYRSAGGTNVAWIDAVYRLLLGRTADAAGESFWNNQLAQGQSRLQVAQGIAGSTENNTQLINDDYFHYLGRAADAQGLNYWLAQFAEGKTNEDVIAGFTGSAEYYNEHTS